MSELEKKISYSNKNDPGMLEPIEDNHYQLKTLSLDHQRDNDPEPVSMRYGFGCFSPDFLQPVFNNAKAFLIFITLANVLQGIIVNGLLKVNVTSIERRFNLLSSESGLIISAYDIAGCLCLLPVSYIGGKGHKPLWIGVGVLLMGIGSIVLALPKFLAGPYVYDYDTSSLGGDLELTCQTGLNNLTTEFSPNCSSVGKHDHYLKQMKYVFMLGQFLNGVGNTPLGVLAITFIDENVEERVYPVYIGIYYMGALLGPAIGFVLGGQMLTKFTNLKETPPGLTPNSPMWVGAWWVGFLVSGIITVLLSVPLFGYPPKLQPQSRKVPQQYKPWWRCCFKVKHNPKVKSPDLFYSKKDGKTGYFGDSQTIDNEVTIEPLMTQQSTQPKPQKCRSAASVLVTDFYNDIIIVLQNKTFIFLSLSASIFATLVSGFSTFGPKFIESQLGKSASDAANLFGYVCIPAGASGMLIGAFLMTSLKMSHKSALQMCIIVSLVGLLAQFVLVLNCNDLPVAGVTASYSDGSDAVARMDTFDLDPNITDMCNEACNCRGNFEPVCDESGMTFYSPCHAGCTTSSLNSEGRKVYASCSCVGDGITHNHTGGSVTSGRCHASPCQWQYIMLFSLFIVILSTFVCTVPGVDLSLRCFAAHHRPLAIGMQWILIRTLGMIPGPIIFGAMIDGTCLLWGKSSCNDDKGSCLMYKNSELSSSFLVLSVIYKTAGIVALSLAMIFIKQDTKLSDGAKVIKETHIYKHNLPSTSRGELSNHQITVA